jgi:hypothetical protein
VLDALDEFSIIYLMRIWDLGAESTLIRYPTDCKGKFLNMANASLRVLWACRDG